MLQITNGTAVLSEEAALQIVEFERMAKEIKQKEDSLKAMILQEMMTGRELTGCVIMFIAVLLAN